MLKIVKCPATKCKYNTDEKCYTSPTFEFDEWLPLELTLIYMVCRTYKPRQNEASIETINKERIPCSHGDIVIMHCSSRHEECKRICKKCKAILSYTNI